MLRILIRFNRAFDKHRTYFNLTSFQGFERDFFYQGSTFEFPEFPDSLTRIKKTLFLEEKQASVFLSDNPWMSAASSATGIYFDELSTRGFVPLGYTEFTFSETCNFLETVSKYFING